MPLLAQWLLSADTHRVPRVRFSAQLRRDVEAAYGRTCWLCRLPVVMPERISLDHVVPVKHGGNNELGNLRPAHSHCNLQRADWDVASYYAWAVSSGLPSRVQLVPAAVRGVVLQDADARHQAARHHYGGCGPVDAPLGGSWAYLSEVTCGAAAPPNA